MADERKDRDAFGSSSNPTPSKPGVGSDPYTGDVGDTTMSGMSSSTYSQGSSTTGSAMDKVQQKAQPAVEQAKQQAGQAVDQAQQQAKSMLHNQKSRAADQLGSVADALHQTGESLNTNQSPFADYAHKAADAVDHFAEDLRTKSVDDLFYEAENFARREPQVFLGGAVLAGILLARFLKASAPQRNYGGQYGDFDRGFNRGTYGQGGYGARSYGQGYTSGSRPDFGTGPYSQPRRNRGAGPFEEGYNETYTGEDFYPESGTGGTPG